MTKSNSERSNLYAVVMAGGAGLRLWPESRAARPKPFLPLGRDGASLLRTTYDRFSGLVAPENRLVVAGRSFEDLTRRELPDAPRCNLLLEPVGRDTALCVAWSSFEIARRDQDAIIITSPSDHAVEPSDRFRDALRRAVELVREDETRIVTLGIAPTAPSSAFGYIERGEPLDAQRDAFLALSFREKPDVETARGYLATGNYLWNAGIFVWRASTILALIRRFEPSLAETLDAFEALAAHDPNWRDSQSFADAFASAKRVSIDRAVLERAPNVVVVQADQFAWNDLGSFDALEQVAVEQPDGSDNLSVGAPLVALNSTGVRARVCTRSGRKLVAVVGLDDLLVVDTPDALLVAKRGDADALKELAALIRKQGYEEFL